MLIAVLAFIVHKCKWEKDYNVGEGMMVNRNNSFKSAEWGNEKCDDYFKGLIREQEVDIVQLPPDGQVDLSPSANPEAKLDIPKFEIKDLKTPTMRK